MAEYSRTIQGLLIIALGIVFRIVFKFVDLGMEESETSEAIQLIAELFTVLIIGGGTVYAYQGRVQVGDITATGARKPKAQMVQEIVEDLQQGKEERVGLQTSVVQEVVQVMHHPQAEQPPPIGQHPGDTPHG